MKSLIAAVAIAWTPQVGDIVFSTNTTRPGRLPLYRIARAGPPTHVAIVYQRPNGSYGLLESTEHTGVVVSSFWELTRPDRTHVYVRRIRRPLTRMESRTFQIWAERQIGKPFAGYVRAGMTALGPCTLQPFRAQLESRKWACSELAAAATVALGRVDATGVAPKLTDPQDLISDEFLNLSKHWEKPVPWDTRGLHP